MLNERFWSKTILNTQTGCIEWSANKNNKGYGLFSVNSKTGKKLAHRLSFENSNGPIPKGLFILHKCDNPKCVNPAHLYAGTQLQNVHDSQSRNRHVPPPSFPGEANLKSKLTEKEVLQIRSEIKAGRSPIEIAKELGMNKTTIYDIRNRKTWVHI